MIRLKSTALVSALFLGMALPLSAQTPSIISVSGEGAVAVSPDMARIVLGVMFEEEEAGVAMGKVSQVLSQMRDVLTAEGVEAKDIQTRSLSVSPRYSYPPEKGPVFVGFTASSQLELRLRDLSAVPAVLDQLMREGANSVEGITFEVQDRSALLNEARRAAVADAQARAALLADAAGVTLGPILSLQEGSAHVPEHVMMRLAAPASDAALPVIEGGEVQISASVQLVYEIAP